MRALAALIVFVTLAGCSADIAPNYRPDARAADSQAVQGDAVSTEAATTPADASAADVQCLAGRTACAGGCFDLTTSDTNCGACGVSCATTPPHMHALGCSAGVCGFACDAPSPAADGGFDVSQAEWRDCDGLQANGCEVEIATDVANCAACGRRCDTLACRAHNCVTP